jgi:hypothetical protein
MLFDRVSDNLRPRSDDNQRTGSGQNLIEHPMIDSYDSWHLELESAGCRRELRPRV